MTVSRGGGSPVCGGPTSVFWVMTCVRKMARSASRGAACFTDWRLRFVGLGDRGFKRARWGVYTEDRGDSQSPHGSRRTGAIVQYGGRPYAEEGSALRAPPPTDRMLAGGLSP